MAMKIIAKDNFDRENRSDRVLAENVSEFYANMIAIALNHKYGGDNSDDHYVAKPDDYQPYKFEP